MPNIDQVQLPDGSQYNLRDNISGYVTAQYVNDVIDGLTKANVGLGNVDNTSDLNKPVSTAQQTALNGKTDTTVIAPTEATTTASRRYEIGEQFILNGVLYTATAVIASGDTIIVDTNCELSESITKQLKDIDLSADNVTFDNTGTDLVSENVEDAIKEVDAKTQHGLFESWVNPSPTTTFAGQNIYISTDYTLDAVMIEFGNSSGNSRGTLLCEIGNTALPNLINMDGSGNIAYAVRSMAVSSVNGGYKVVVSDCVYRSRTNAGAVTQSTENSEIIPLRILGLVHNN